MRLEPSELFSVKSLDSDRFWAETPPHWRREVIAEGAICNAVGVIYMDRPMYSSPALRADIKRPLKKRLFTRPWHPLDKTEEWQDRAWVFTTIPTIKYRSTKDLEIILVCPQTAIELQQALKP